MNMIPLSELILDAKSGFASGEKDNEGIAQIRMNNVTTDGELDLSSIRRVPVKTVKNVESFILNEGDVLFNSTNSSNLVGKSVRFVEQNEPFVFSNHFLRLVPDPEQLESPYLARWLTYQQQQGVFELLCTKWVNQAAVRRGDLLALKIPLPPLPEQRRIAAVLDAADALRAKRRAALAKLDALLQSVFLEMFGDPVRNEKGWEVVTVSDVAAKEKYSIKAGPFGSSLRKEYYVPVGYKIYGQEQVIRDDLTYGDYYIDQARYDSLKANRIKAGDILISLVGTFGKVSVVPEDFEPGIINPRLMKITLDRHKMHPLFFKQLLSMPSILNRITDDSHGGTMGIVNVGIMKDVPIPAPPIDIQERYVEILDRINEIKAQFSLNHERFMTLFESLQQRAFRGELSSIERNK